MYTFFIFTFTSLCSRRRDHAGKQSTNFLHAVCTFTFFTTCLLWTLIFSKTDQPRWMKCTENKMSKMCSFCRENNHNILFFYIFFETILYNQLLLFFMPLLPPRHAICRAVFLFFTTTNLITTFSSTFSSAGKTSPHWGSEDIQGIHSKYIKWWVWFRMLYTNMCVPCTKYYVCR